MTKFRIGATSFVYPMDWVGNVKRLAGRVGDIEILIFEPDAMPSRDDIDELVRLGTHGHSYTVHTPLTASLASTDSERRRRGVDEVVATIRHTQALTPHAWIVHVYLGDREGDVPPADLDGWRERASESLREVVAEAGGGERICVETLDYDVALIEPVIRDVGTSIAWDVGHFHRDDRPWAPMLRRNRDIIRVIQWHGTDPDDRDHRSLRFVPPHVRRELLLALHRGGYDGVVTLEVFREHDFEESLALCQDDLQRVLS